MHHTGKTLGKIFKEGMQIAVGRDRLRNLQQRLVSIGKRLTGRSGWPIHSRAVWRINHRRLKRPLIEGMACESPCAQNVLCVPSQNDGFFLCLHWHSATSFFSATVNSTGSIPVPSWQPSQNG